MTFEAYFERVHQRLQDDLGAFMASKRGDVGRLRPWGPDALLRLTAFTQKGKMIRGGLVLLGCEMAGGRAGRAALRAGTAFELIQSGLLIHDDIIDRDPRRRGGPSVHEQYARFSPAAPGGGDAAHYGLSLALCAGDIAIFLAFEAMAGLPGPPERVAAVQRLFAAEFGTVGLGQMLDIAAGASRGELTRRRILDIYRYKTARYSFFLPLAAGWILGGGPARTLPTIERLGEDLGLVFQIKDDELGLFGQTRATGKPVGNDIRQGKRTLHAAEILGRSAGADRKRFRAVFGRPGASAEDIAFVRDLAARTGSRDEVRRIMLRLGRRAAREIRTLPVGDAHRSLLEGLLAYLLDRRS
jgi:geranylgeranyl diphosphate synthase, type I